MENSTEMLICLEILKQQNIWKSKASCWVAFMDILEISQIILHSSIKNQHKKFMTSKYQNMTLINDNC